MDNSFSIKEIETQNNEIHKAINRVIAAAQEVEKTMEKVKSRGYKSSEATPLINKLHSRIEFMDKRNTTIHNKQNNAIIKSKEELSSSTSKSIEALD